ncbi:hypothetical protein FHS53_002618 [Xanthobacter tagetidis]|nr:hypothetical protein [Xanthobacter tagetidis]
MPIIVVSENEGTLTFKMGSQHAMLDRSISDPKAEE